MIYLYTDHPHASASVEEIEPFLKSLNLPVTFCGEVTDSLIPENAHERFAQTCASLRIKEFRKKRNFYKNLPQKFIEEEMQFVQGNQPMELKDDASNVYEGFLLAKFFRSFVPIEKQNDLHLIITSRLPLTWDDVDFRYHGRTFVCEQPLALISTTGLVEAPAKPKEYYLYEMAIQRMKETSALTGNAPLVEEKSNLNFLTYDDMRMKECLRGVVLQAVFFLALLEPFCGDKTCRLYNAHWQEEMLEAQTRGKLCARHKNLLENTAPFV